MGGGLVNIDVGGFFKGLFSLGSELIEDKDKRNEFNMKIAKFEGEFNTAIVTMKTHPYVDALVKLMYATVALYRPLGTMAMTAFGVYAHIKGMNLGTAQYMFDGALLGWGVSRHLEKGRK